MSSWYTKEHTSLKVIQSSSNVLIIMVRQVSKNVFVLINIFFKKTTKLPQYFIFGIIDLTGELEQTKREAGRLSEENRSARQQLALVQKEASMMEMCKDELIESIKIKQERTDSQLKNFREVSGIHGYN